MDIRKRKLKGYIALSVLIIVCLIMTSAMTFFTPKNRTIAITVDDISSKYSTDKLVQKEMLISGYEKDTTGSGKVFLAEVFWLLMDRISGGIVTNKTQFESWTKEGQEKTSQDFRSYNDGNDIVVTIGGKQWVATYLSQNGKKEPILTLWLANSANGAKMNAQSENSTGNYPNGMYGTSLMRASTLNNGGGYAATYNAAALTPVSQTISSEWAIYTVPNTTSGMKGSLTDFIEVPNNVSWQQEQQALKYITSTAYTAQYGYNNNNDALNYGSKNTEGQTTGKGAAGSYSNKKGYADWGDDRLWLPSITETGVSGEEGIWKASDSTRENSMISWTRSACVEAYHTYYVLGVGGASMGKYNPLNTHAVRPAFHLNLAKAAQSVGLEIPQTKGDVKQYYSEGGSATFELDKINKNLVDIKISATGVKKPDGTISTITNIPTCNVSEDGLLTFNASEVGEYTVSVTPNTGYVWSDGSTSAKTYTYKLKYHVTLVELNVTNPNNLVYNGDYQYLPLRYYNENLVKVTINNTDDVELNDGVYCIKTKDAKTYSASIELVDKNLMEWTDNNGTENRTNISVTVRPRTLSVTANGAWQTSARTQKEFVLTLDGVCDNDVGLLDFWGYYTYQSDNEIPISAQPTLSEDNKQITITLPSVDDIGTTADYNYILKLNSANSLSKNYTLNFSKAFAVEKANIEISAEDIVWQYTNHNIAGGVNQAVGDVSGTFEVDYNGEEYTFLVATKYTDANVYPTIETSLSGNSGRNATASGYNTAVFILTSTDDSIELRGTTRFELRWKINKAKFVLSNIRWDYTQPFEYNEDIHRVTVSGVPSGLTASYDLNWGVDVNDYTTTLSLTIDDNLRSNYEVPINGQPNTYIYNGSGDDVMWTLSWKIIAGTLNLEWETINTYTVHSETYGDRVFSYPTVLSRYSEYIDGYEYYLATDYNNGNPTAGTAKTLADIVVLPETVFNYYAVAILDSDWVGNYELSTQTKAQSFRVGSMKKEIIVSMSEREFVYDGEKHGESWTHTTSGSSTINRNRIEAKFYSIDDVDNALTEAPINSGKYVIKFRIPNASDAEIFELMISEIRFEIIKAEITATPSESEFTYLYDGTNREGAFELASDNGIDVSNGYIVTTYYKGNQEIDAPSAAGEYIIVLSVADAYKDNYAISGETQFTLIIACAKITATQSASEYLYDGTNREGEFTFSTNNGIDASDINIVKKYYKVNGDEQVELTGGTLPSNAGTYKIVLSIGGNDVDNYYIDEDTTEFTITITPLQITAEWDTTGEIPTLKGLADTEKEKVEYVYTDSEGNIVEDVTSLEADTYTVTARIKSEYAGNYVFVDGDGQVLANATSTEKSFDIKAEEPENPDDPITTVDPTNPEDPEPPTTSFDFSKILDAIKNNWQPILSIVSILFSLIFMGKGIGYAGKRKKAKKTVEKKYSTYYAISGVGLFGLPNMTWTIIACIMAGVAVLAFVFMLLQKKAYTKAMEEMEDAKEEYNRNMFMRGNMNGGMGQQGVVYQQPQFAIEDMRGMINEAMSAMLPNVTQYLPQEASYNDELVQQLIDQNAQNEERIRQLTQENEERIKQLTSQNEEIIRNLAQGQEMLMQRLAEQPKESVNEEVIEKLVEKLAKQQMAEQEAEKEVASTVVNEKTLEELKETIRAEIQTQMTAKEEKSEKDDKIEMLLKANERLMQNQEMLMQKLANQEQDKTVYKKVENSDSTEIIKSLIEGQRSIMEKLVDKPNEKHVEKIVEKEAVKEVPVEKVVPMPIEKSTKAEKAPAPRLTLDEAYAKLSANQKKIFDTLKNYALSKDKCKEKKSTYFTVLGQSTVNPLVKLTIKKNTTVAMFKMEDEYMKDIRKNATSDGTKVKVKETELVVSDNQALATAKDMIDLREDQIERYNDYLKEQRSMKKK